jgi:hypothetical protein
MAVAVVTAVAMEMATALAEVEAVAMSGHPPDTAQSGLTAMLAIFVMPCAIEISIC